MSKKITDKELKELGFSHYPKSGMYGDFWSLDIHNNDGKEITLFIDRYWDVTLNINEETLREYDPEIEFTLQVKTYKELKQAIKILKSISKILK